MSVAEFGFCSSIHVRGGSSRTAYNDWNAECDQNRSYRQKHEEKERAERQRAEEIAARKKREEEEQKRREEELAAKKEEEKRKREMEEENQPWWAKYASKYKSLASGKRLRLQRKSGPEITTPVRRRKKRIEDQPLNSPRSSP